MVAVLTSFSGSIDPAHQVASMHRAPAALTSAQLSTWPWPSQRVQHTSFLRLPLRNYSSCQWQVASSARLAAKLMTCRRCKQQFTAADNTSSSCRYHPSLFSGGEVAKAIGFVRASDAPEDQLERVVGRKGLLRFWDCCGMEDEAAPGCCVGFHVTYDAEVNEAHAWE